MSDKDRMIELLEELVKWARVAGIPKVKALLLEILTSAEEKSAYELSDGEKTSRELANQVNTGKATIARWWGKWIKAGIAEPISVKGGGKRARKLFPLDDFGIEVPQIEEATAKEGAEEE